MTLTAPTQSSRILVTSHNRNGLTFRVSSFIRPVCSRDVTLSPHFRPVSYPSNGARVCAPYQIMSTVSMGEYA